jgi:antitoxin VapB
MKTAKLFDNGRSQALRLPKEYRFRGREVYVRKINGLVLLIPKASPWASLVHSLERFSPDFLETRAQPVGQPRDAL